MTELQPIETTPENTNTALSFQITHLQAMIFDWDGVFNNGYKSENNTSGFSEPDSMGLNMLRYGLWKQNGQQPFFYIVSGEDNPTAWKFAQREHFAGVYFKTKNKAATVLEIAQRHNIEPQQIACMFDDINDLSMAALCGVRFVVGREANPLFIQYVIKNRLCDYVTHHSGGNYAIREVCELLLGAMNIYDTVVTERMLLTDNYQKYFNARNAIEPMLFTQS